MADLIANIIAAFITVPLLGFIVVYFVSKKIIKNSKRSVHIAIDFSTVLLILSVHHLILVIWDTSYLWFLLLLMIFVALCFVLVHWKIKREIVFRAIFKGFWRMNFLLFFTAYILLAMFGLIQRIISL